MEKIRPTRPNIPRLLDTFQIKSNFGELQWYLITMNTNFSTKNPTFKEKFIKIQNLNGKEIYFAGKIIQNIQYNIIYIGIMNWMDNETVKSSNLVFFVTTKGLNLKISNLTRKFMFLFNNIIGLKLLKRDNDEYSLKSFTFKNQNFTDKKPFKKNLFLYFKENINFSLKIMNELKTKLDKNIIDFVLWNSDTEKPNEIEMYEYLNNLKGFLNKNKSKPEKWYIEFILLFKTLGADYYSKNKRNIFKYIPTHKIDDSKRIGNERTEYLKKESFKILTEKTIGENIKIFFSNEMVKKNEKNTHIFIDGSSIGKTHSSIIVMTLQDNLYKCLFFIKYEKNKEIVKKHMNKCSRKKIKIKSDLCMCEWLCILDFILLQLKFITSISIDFEPGLISAANKKNLKIFGCYFHYLQNLHKKTQKSKITKILVSICENIPFCKFKTRNDYIGELANVMEEARNTNKRINEFNDYKIIEYLQNFVYSKSIDKFNYIVQTREDYFKLTNNCCERYFKYLKDEVMSSGYTFEESILVRMYLDLVGFFKTVKSSLKNKYDDSGVKLRLLVKKYINKINNDDIFQICEKKSKKDKNFNKSSKKTNISKSKKNIIIESEFESEFEFEKTTFNEIKSVKSLKFLQNTFDNKKTYSETYKSQCINYIGKNLQYNVKTADLLKKTKEDIKEKDKIIEEKDKIIKKTYDELVFNQSRIFELENELKKLKSE